MSSLERYPVEFSNTSSQERRFEALDKLLEPHILSSEFIDETETKRMLTFLDRDESQLTHHVDGSPIPPADIGDVASMIDKTYNGLKNKVYEELNKNKHTITATGDLLRDGKTVILATNHLDLTDMAKDFGVMQQALWDFGYEDLFSKDPDTGENIMNRGIIVHQMLSRVGINTIYNNDPIPASLALAQEVDDIWYSNPDTESNAEMREEFEDEVKMNNWAMIDGLMRRTHEKAAYFYAMAPSGSKDKLIEGRTNAYAMQQLKKGTIRLMQRRDTYTLFMGVSLLSDEPAVVFCGDKDDGPKRILTVSDAHYSMQRLGNKLTEASSGNKFIYDTPLFLGETALNGAS